MWILSGLALLAATLGAATAWRMDDRAARVLLALVPVTIGGRIVTLAGPLTLEDPVRIGGLVVVTALLAGLVSALLMDRVQGLIALGYLAAFGLLAVPWRIVAGDGLPLEWMAWSAVAAITLLAVVPLVLRRREAGAPPAPRVNT